MNALGNFTQLYVMAGLQRMVSSASIQRLLEVPNNLVERGITLEPQPQGLTVVKRRRPGVKNGLCRRILLL